MADITPRPRGDVLGVVLLVRHGDREGFYQNATDYTPSNTAITPLGNAQEYQLGQLLRSIYFNTSSPSFIFNVDYTVVRNDQVLVRADAGGEGGVIFNSAVSLLQGLFPPTEDYKVTLANGTTITGPLGGYQAVPIESVEPDNDISLEGWTSCKTFKEATNSFYASDAFKKKAAEHDIFLKQLPAYLDGRPVTLENMWNIFDFMNVQSIHNATFAKALPPTFLEQARDLANFHEYGIFSSPKPDGIGNIAGHTILPSILEGLTGIADASNPRKFIYQALSYKPFISLFNLTGAAEMNPELAGFVNFAGALALEVRRSESGGEPVVRFNFKNGTEDSFKTYSFLGSEGDVPLSKFVDTLKPVAFNDLPTWCKVCDNQQDRGCAELYLNSPASTTGGSRYAIGSVGAGFLGAGVTLAVMVAMLAVLFFLGFITFGRKRKTARVEGYDTDSMEQRLKV